MTDCGVKGKWVFQKWKWSDWFLLQYARQCLLINRLINIGHIYGPLRYFNGIDIDNSNDLQPIITFFSNKIPKTRALIKWKKTCYSLIFCLANSVLLINLNWKRRLRLLIGGDKHRIYKFHSQKWRATFAVNLKWLKAIHRLWRFDSYVLYIHAIWNSTLIGWIGAYILWTRAKYFRQLFKSKPMNCQYADWLPIYRNIAQKLNTNWTKHVSHIFQFLYGILIFVFKCSKLLQLQNR